MAESEKLVCMTKDGVILKVHPTCVKAHEEVGWTQAPVTKEKEPDPAPKADPKKADTHAKGNGADNPEGETGADTPKK